MIKEASEVEALLTGGISSEKRRFETLLTGEDLPGSPIHDRPLLKSKDWLVAPSLGAIVPNWLLIVARDNVINFRVWAEVLGRSPVRLIEEVRAHLGLRAEEIIWFEHGPRINGTLVGCGLDHAHIHILIRPTFTFDAFATEAKSMAWLEWKSETIDGAYKNVRSKVSYLAAGSGDLAIVAQNVESTGSQFFRRVVARLARAGDTWDYRQAPHADHVLQTVGTFRSLESEVRRVG